MEQALKEKNLLKIAICDDDDEYIDHLHTAIKLVMNQSGFDYTLR